MPSNVVKSFSQKSGKTEKEVEKIWDELKAEYGEDYAKITGTLKKILGLNEATSFKDFLKEERNSNEYGLEASGQMMGVRIKMNLNNDLMEVSVKGNRYLSKLKSVDNLKSEYRDEDHETIEKIWKKLAEKHSKDVESLVEKFERDLNKIVIAMEKELAKF